LPLLLLLLLLLLLHTKPLWEPQQRESKVKLG
jgi:hypothetical protein